MKIAANQIEAFIKNPNKDLFLIYGPDEGLVRERAKLLALQICPNLNDAFQVSQFSCDDLKETPSKLNDEALSQSLLGGKRVIWVYGVADKYGKQIEQFIADYPGGNRIILQAGDLATSSKIRKAAEKNQNIASIPCYHDDERKIGQIIQAGLQKEGFTIDRNTLSFLEENLGEDRSLTRQLIEKLSLYAAGQSEITQEMAEDILSDYANLSLDDLFYAILGHDEVKALRILDKLRNEAVAEIMILRSLQNQFLKFYKVKCQIEAGIAAQTAISSLRPPLFFKYKPKFTSALPQWSVAAVEAYIKRLTDAELDVKSGIADGFSILNMLSITPSLNKVA